MEYYKQAHCVYYAKYHLVFPTKYRKRILVNNVKLYFEETLKKVTEYYPDLKFHEINGEEDHVHLLITIPPKMSVSKVVSIIKANTSTALKNRFKFIKKAYWGTDGMWSDGYFVSTIGVNEDIISKYIEHQGKDDSGQIRF